MQETTEPWAAVGVRVGVHIGGAGVWSAAKVVPTMAGGRCHQKWNEKI